MTPRQKELARHALGLKDGNRKSYRNYFAAGESHSDYPDWMAMVDADYARVQPAMGAARYDTFTLTYFGAQLALNEGERLDPEDFPR